MVSASLVSFFCYGKKQKIVPLTKKRTKVLMKVFQVALCRGACGLKSRLNQDQNGVQTPAIGL